MTSTADKKIEITVSPEGTTSIKTSGFIGAPCKDATRELERALGVPSRETLLPAYYQQATTGDHIRQST